MGQAKSDRELSNHTCLLTEAFRANSTLTLPEYLLSYERASIPECSVIYKLGGARSY